MATVIGAGIAGSALAGALARRGAEVTLYERSARTDAGAFLFIDGRGHDALTGLGVDTDALMAASYPLTGGLSYADSAGRHGTSPSRGHRFWLRHNLMRVLHGFVESSGARTHYGLAATWTALTDDVTDGLLIGADGIDSVVRSHIEPTRVPVYTGDNVVYGMTTEPVELLTSPATLHFFAETDSTGRVFSTLGHLWRPGDSAALWFVRIVAPPLPDRGAASGVRPVSEWADRIRAACPSNLALVDTFLGATASVHVSNARTIPLEDAASPGERILLIGDADHAITPAAGVGARDALEDAYAVHQALISGASPADAMTARRHRILADRAAALRARPSASRAPASSEAGPDRSTDLRRDAAPAPE
ncbi:FAD-dependent oxidoreductase [Nocardia sp. NPDC056611]|uniref:FAD-dependent oxidoreductase n=1 Tax=Nocardia sp. NPDC056611 TaxID=3345877 RepID=UPI00366EB089